MDLVQDLPDLWQRKHGGSLLLNNTSTSLLPPTNSTKSATQSMPYGSATLPPFSPEKPHSTNGHGLGMPRTPIHILANASAEFDSYPTYPSSLPPARTSASAASVPWNSPSQRASPTDQLIAAILDGDVQGIRSIVKGKGDDLQSSYWSSVSKSILPLHRALSGLHFHGKKTLLISALEVLLALKADILAVDHMGNNVLHKALQVCSSTSVSQVVRLLIERGAEVRGINKEGDTTRVFAVTMADVEKALKPKVAKTELQLRAMIPETFHYLLPLFEAREAIEKRLLRIMEVLKSRNYETKKEKEGIVTRTLMDQHYHKTFLKKLSGWLSHQVLSLVYWLGRKAVAKSLTEKITKTVLADLERNGLLNKAV
ncbi:ankyrin repeat domain-containing protein [archaeon]|nr:MAG: ankyrin repeat domain-containing protein [archaeon]